MRASAAASCFNEDGILRGYRVFTAHPLTSYCTSYNTSIIPVDRVFPSISTSFISSRPTRVALREFPPIILTFTGSYGTSNTHLHTTVANIRPLGGRPAEHNTNATPFPPTSTRLITILILEFYVVLFGISTYPIHLRLPNGCQYHWRRVSRLQIARTSRRCAISPCASSQYNELNPISGGKPCKQTFCSKGLD